MTALELFFGSVAAREKCRRFLTIASVVVALDLATKLLALRFASEEVPLELWHGAIEIRLTENTSLLGSAAGHLGSLRQVFISGVATLVLSVGGLFVTSARDRPLKKFLVLLGIVFGALLAAKLPLYFPTPTSARFVGVSRALGALACNLLLLRVLLDARLFAASSLVASANFANLFNSIWHPAGVVDFIWIRALQGVLGVTNVADLVMTLTAFGVELLFVFWLAVELLWRLSPTRSSLRALRAFTSRAITSHAITSHATSANLAVQSGMAPRSSKPPPSVPESSSTVRARIAQTLRDAELTAREISQRASVAERDVAEHLRHLEHSLVHAGERLSASAPRCLKCGFAFTERERHSRPSRCPSCKSERISPPRFRIVR